MKTSKKVFQRVFIAAVVALAGTAAGLPALTQNYQAYPAVAPPYAVPPAAYPPAGTAPNPQEERIARLEHSAFGSTYPEHELDDRVEHLEREEFGKVFSGDLESRLARLESKLGAGAFSNSASPASQAAPPAYMPAQYMPPSSSAYLPPPVSAPPAALLPASPPKAPNASPAPQEMACDFSAERSLSDFQTAVESIPADEKSGDYFADITHYAGGCYAHWLNLPVRIHIPLKAEITAKQALKNAVDAWRKCIPIMIAPVNEPADVEIAWIDHLPPKQLGITNLEVFNGRMRATIYLLRPKSKTSSSLLQSVAEHELGHALGLWGHSPVSADLMQAGQAAAAKPAAISQRDINTLKKVYQAPGLPEGFEIPQPVGWTCSR